MYDNEASNLHNINDLAKISEEINVNDLSTLILVFFAVFVTQTLNYAFMGKHFIVAIAQV